MWALLPLALALVAGCVAGVDGRVSYLSSWSNAEGGGDVWQQGGFRFLANATGVNATLTGASSVCTAAVEARMTEINAKRASQGAADLTAVTARVTNLCTQTDGCEVGQLLGSYFYPTLTLFDLKACVSAADKEEIVAYLLDRGEFTPLGISAIPTPVDRAAVNTQVLQGIRTYMKATCASGQNLPSCLDGRPPFAATESPSSGGAAVAVPLAAVGAWHLIA